MTDRDFGAVSLAFVTGLWLALLQFSHLFLLEVSLTSRATTYFVALFFWLIGFLLGLQATSGRSFPLLVLAAAGGYYATLLAFGWLPYQDVVMLLAAICIGVGGAAAGAFFPFAAGRFAHVKWLLFHENNGFVLGIVGALIGAVFEGRWLLGWAPALGAMAVTGLLVASRPRG